MSDEGDVVEISYVPDDPETDNEPHEEEQKSKKSGSKKKTATPKAGKLQKQLKEQEEIMTKVVEERNEFKDKYLRGLAEIDNFRKRVNKEKDEFRKYVMGDFILGLLEVVDNLERALKAKTATAGPATGDEKSIVSGVEMIYKQLMDYLKKNKLEEIDSLGKVFDPNIHQALSKDEREGISQPVVLEVYQKGFLYNGKLLRPTLVKVAMPKEPETVETPDEGDGEAGE